MLPAAFLAVKARVYSPTFPRMRRSSNLTTPAELVAVDPVNDVRTTPAVGVAVAVKVTSLLAVVRLPNASHRKISTASATVRPAISVLFAAVRAGSEFQVKLATAPGVMLKVSERTAVLVVSVPPISVIWNSIL